MPALPFGYILRDRNCTRVQLQRINTYYALALRFLNKQHFLYKQTGVQIQRHVWDELLGRFSKGHFSKTLWYISILFEFRSRIVWSWQRSYLDKTKCHGYRNCIEHMIRKISKVAEKMRMFVWNVYSQKQKVCVKERKHVTY